MQLLPRYLVEQTTILVADVAGYITEYRPVYNRDIEVYKGIDNALQFRLLNADQKGINLSSRPQDLSPDDYIKLSKILFC